MASLLPTRPLAGCLRSCFRSAREIPASRRYASLMKINSTTSRPLLFHTPKPDQPRRRIRIHTPIPAIKTKDPLGALTALHLQTLDPTGARQKMFSRHNKDSIRPGDILQVRRKDDEPFAGVLLNIRRRGVDTAFLLRNQLTRVGVEVWFKLYSPTIEGIDLVQRREKRARRAKLYYMRKPTHDIGSVQNIVTQYMRQRALMRGESAMGHGKKRGKR